MYKISVIIPIFNVKNYLKKALNSIINQTFDLQDIEIILIDDASTDGSYEIAKEYAMNYSNFKLIQLENNSGSAAVPRNIGIQNATADYVMFLDPDDEYCKDYCEIMYNTIKKYDVDCVKCNFITIINDIPFYNRYFDKTRVLAVIIEF